MIPEEGQEPEKILEELKQLTRYDADSKAGRITGSQHYYETSLPGLRALALRAYEMYMHRSFPDIAGYPSVISLERKIVETLLGLTGGTSGIGTTLCDEVEAALLAVKTMRDYYRRKRPGEIPKIIVPETIHPGFRKAAYYLGVKLVTAPVDRNTWQVSIEDVESLVDDETGMIISSAPNHPFGVMDDIEALSRIALDNAVWLHVDASIGGLILPFLRELGETIPGYDFELPGVVSMNTSLHRYGYSPIPLSAVLYRSREYWLYQPYASLDWPGPIHIDTGVVSAGKPGALAAAWATIQYLGRKGYLEQARHVVRARKAVLRRLEKLGYSVLGNPATGVIAFTSETVDLAVVAKEMAERGWLLDFQPGSEEKEYPPSLRLTITPLHSLLLEDFTSSLEEATQRAEKGKEPGTAEETAKQLATMPRKQLVENISLLVESMIDWSRDPPIVDYEILVYLARFLPPRVGEKLLVLLLSKIFSL